MIHDVTIPFCFDTTPIERQIEAIGEREVARVIEEVTTAGINKAMPKKSTYGYYGSKEDGEIDWARFVGRRVDDWISEHSQDIIDEAALLLAARVSRKKAWRETLVDLRESGALGMGATDNG